MWICSIARSELTGAFGCETALGVAAGARKAASACSEDGGFAGLQGARRDEKDELELLKGAHDESDDIWVTDEERRDGGLSDDGFEDTATIDERWVAPPPSRKTDPRAPVLTGLEESCASGG